MSSSEERKARGTTGALDGSRRRAVLGLASLLAAGPLLAACGDGGFRPLYATSGIGVNVPDKLAEVDIAPIPGRVGQRIRNELIFQTTGGGNPAPPKYRLEIAITETISTTLVAITGDSQNQIYNLDANFKLIRLSDKAVVLKGESAGRAGLERFSNIFSNVRARQDAENRAAKTVGIELKTRLSAYLATAV